MITGDEAMQVLRQRIREQLAAAGVQCQHPSCTAQATGVAVIGKVAPYLCDPHLSTCLDGHHPEHEAVRQTVEHAMLDEENRTRYPNGLTRTEWLGLR